jgi:hypothetical protein
MFQMFQLFQRKYRPVPIELGLKEAIRLISITQPNKLTIRGMRRPCRNRSLGSNEVSIRIDVIRPVPIVIDIPVTAYDNKIIRLIPSLAGQIALEVAIKFVSVITTLRREFPSLQINS